MDNQTSNSDSNQFTKVTDSIEQNPLDEKEITWWKLIVSVAKNKTTWIIVFGMFVLLFGYFSGELFTDKIEYDNDGLFKQIKVKKTNSNTDSLHEFNISGRIQRDGVLEIYVFSGEEPVKPIINEDGSFTQKLKLPKSFNWLYAKSTYKNFTTFYRFHLKMVRQYQIQKAEYEAGIKTFDSRWESRDSFWYEPRKAVNLIVQGLIFFFGAIFSALILGINPLKLGLKLGDFKNWVPITALFILIMLPIVYFTAHTDAFKNSYPSDYSARNSIDVFMLTTFAFLVYFLGWEFIFRGYFLMALKDRIGIVPAILFQMIPFAAMHINKPPLEAMSSIIGGIILGILVIRVRSFWPCVIIHWVMHAAINYFVCILHYW